MANIQFVDLNGLRTFKTKQNEYNLAHFASLSGGKVTAEQLPSFVDDVVECYTTKNSETSAITFYSDAAKTQPITGETGKIYVDLGATIDGSYRYTGSQFVAIGTSVSTADKAINDANGNPIIETYATKDELGTAATTAATKNSLGVVPFQSGLVIISTKKFSANFPQTLRPTELFTAARQQAKAQ